MTNNESTRAGGFTLVELLVTSAVLAMATALLVAVAGNIRREGLVRFTDEVIRQVDTALSAYYDRCGAWPPDRFDAAGPGPTSRPDGGSARGPWIRPTQNHAAATEGVECLLRALGGGGFWSQPAYRRTVANTDGDCDKLTDRPLEELVDGWGCPLLYYNGFGQADGGPLPLFDGLDPARMDELNQSLIKRWRHRDRRPLVDSAGPDGVLDTSDDPRQDSRR